MSKRASKQAQAGGGGPFTYTNHQESQLTYTLVSGVVFLSFAFTVQLPKRMVVVFVTLSLELDRGFMDFHHAQLNCVGVCRSRASS